jgi:hypothetical protein
MCSRVSKQCRGLALAIVTGLWAPVGVHGQTPPPSALVNQQSEQTVEAARAASLRSAEETFAIFEDDAEAAIAKAVERVWDPTRPRPSSPRTAWGDPDLAGYWLSASYTPLERPDELAGKPLYTPEEAIEVFQRAVALDAGVDPATVHYDWTEFGMDNWQSPIRPNRRTALIVDPPDGKIPPLTPEGRERYEAQARLDTLESRGITERCIVGSEGPPRLPFIQQIGESRIVQTRDHIVLIAQNNSDVRIIPLDGRPRLSDNIRNWLGESRGHWDGDTLVVETTNFHPDRKWVRPQEMDGDLHLVERLTRIDADTVLYEATMTDPTTWEAPWTIEIPWPKMEPPGLFEFACHEQNYGLINVLTGARVRAAEFEAAQESDD